MACPACDHPVSEPLFRRDAVPAAQNVRIRDRQAALRAPQATLDLVGCTVCGHVWNRAFDATRLVYGAEYDNRQDLSPRFFRHLNERARWITRQVGEGRDVVEVGCGNGVFLNILCETGGHRGVGYDTAYRGPETEGRARFVRGYYGPDQSFVPVDLVVCRHVIEHVADPAALLLTLRGALAGRPDARVFFECPDFSWICAQDAVWDLFHEHVQYFSAASLATLFRRSGYGDVQVEAVFDGQYLQLAARPAGQRAHLPPPISSPLSAARAFAQRVARRTAAWTQMLAAGPWLVWGAGAKGVTFVTHLDPQAEHVTALVDVNPAKQGCFVPVTGHPIVGPTDLARYGAHRILVLNPSYVDEVRAACPGFDVYPPEIPCESSSTTKLAS